jgi:phospholipase C
VPTQNGVIIGVPAQEKGVRPARALPYEMDVVASINASNSNASNSTVLLTFLNTGSATVVFHVRSGNAAEPARMYTVEPGKSLTGSWNVASSYDLSVYGPNGFARYFSGGAGSNAATLDISSTYGSEGGRPTITCRITNVAAAPAGVIVLDAYTGDVSTKVLQPHEPLVEKVVLDQFHGWYDLIVKVSADPSFKYRLAGHVETGTDSFSDPALGGLVTLKS